MVSTHAQMRHMLRHMLRCGWRDIIGISHHYNHRHGPAAVLRDSVCNVCQNQNKGDQNFFIGFYVASCASHRHCLKVFVCLGVWLEHAGWRI